MKKQLRGFLEASWYWYLLLALVISSFYYGLSVVVNTPSTEETLSLFIGCKDVENAALSEKLYADFQGSEIKKVAVDSSDPAGLYYASVFQTRGLVNTDVLVLSSDSITSDNYARYFQSFDPSSLSSYVTATAQDCAQKEGLCYGLPMGEKRKADIPFASGLSYYLFFNKKSTKLGALASSKTDAALRLARSLIA